MLKFDFNLLWTFFDLLIFFIIMRALLLKPIKKTMDARKALIQKQFDDAADVSAQADAKLKDYEDRIANVEAEGEQIIADAKESAKVEYSKIIDRAQQDADALKAEAQKRIDEEREAARRASKEELTSLAMQAAEKVIGNTVSASSDSDIFDEFLKENND